MEDDRIKKVFVYNDKILLRLRTNVNQRQNEKKRTGGVTNYVSYKYLHDLNILIHLKETTLCFECFR